jgi:hypothetical protein
MKGKIENRRTVRPPLIEKYYEKWWATRPRFHESIIDFFTGDYQSLMALEK